ncbi:MAG TPA: RNA polymerase sigma factor [Pirellulales bacterium]|nr:RNA polymerase sigma factor [Pirellulales bacterium]
MIVDFHSLFERHSQDVYRFSLYLSGDPSLAEEVTQETFVRAWTTSGEIRGGTARAYLLAIARNLLHSERKRLNRHVAFDVALPDPKPGPDVVASARLELSVTLDALQALPETDRAALLMHAQDGLPYASIAEVLGLSVPAVKVRVHRARVKLRELCSSVAKQ